MAKHRTYSIEFKRQVAQEFLAGETLHGLARRHHVYRGVRLSQKIGDNWEIVGAAEAGFNPFSLRLINGPKSHADNVPYTAALQRTAFDSARAGNVLRAGPTRSFAAPAS
jgi:hypothetical protein